MKRMTLVAYK